jgi:DNA modification methylase
VSSRIHYADDSVTLYCGDALDVACGLDDGSVDCIVTSPPYFGLRDYGIDGQYGLESTPTEYVERLRKVFSELRRVLADDGTLWLNLGDSYSAGGHGGNAISKRHNRVPGVPVRVPGFAPKNLLFLPHRVAIALQDDGWIARNGIVWSKPNAMPESVTDRMSNRYEHVFLFSKSRRYWFDLDPIREPLLCPDAADGSRVFGGKNKGAELTVGSAARRSGLNVYTNADKGRNPGDVWTLNTQPFPAAHFAVFPVALPQRCILAGCKPGGVVLDPFSGSGTTGLAAQRTGRRYVGVDINAEYLDLSLNTRLREATLDFG